MEETFRDRIDALRNVYLERVLALIDATVLENTPAGSTLVEMNRYHMSTGGKRLRALLPLAVADALGEDPEKLIPFAAACELLHNATLVHDDLQDGDTTRRGEETIWARFGEARAINLGDAMLYWTLALASKLEGAAERREKVTARIVRETIRVIDGQEREFELQRMGERSAQDYFRMVEGKTSGLFALPMLGAAAYCGASDALLEALERSSQHLGVLFQIQDDVLDLYGDKGRERRGSDIAEGKISALVVHALENTEGEERAELSRILEADRDEVTDDEISWVIELFERSGSRDFALAEIERRRQAALSDPRLAERERVRALLSAMADLFLAPIQPLLG